MIGFSSQYGHGAVELFREDEAHHLMRKGHAGEGDFVVRPLVDLLGEPVGTSDDENEAFETRSALLLDV